MMLKICKRSKETKQSWYSVGGNAGVGIIKIATVCCSLLSSPRTAFRSPLSSVAAVSFKRSRQDKVLEILTREVFIEISFWV